MIVHQIIGIESTREAHRALNPLESPGFLAALETTRTESPAVWVAFWLAVGMELNTTELMDLQWENVSERDGEWLASVRVGNKLVKSGVAPSAVAALLEFRQESGPVLRSGSLGRLAALLQRHAPGQSLNALRAIFERPGRREVAA